MALQAAAARAAGCRSVSREFLLTTAIGCVMLPAIYDSTVRSNATTPAPPEFFFDLL
jgi:hypothetical protein